MTYHRWPSKPSPGDLCEASLGWEPDFMGMPRLGKCGKQATVTNKVAEGMDVTVYLCDAHSHLGYPNPHKKRET